MCHFTAAYSMSGVNRTVELSAYSKSFWAPGFYPWKKTVAWCCHLCPPCSWKLNISGGSLQLVRAAQSCIFMMCRLAWF